MEQEKLITITNKQRKDIIKKLSVYKMLAEKGYKEIKKKSPHQSKELAKFLEEIEETGKILIILKKA